MESRTTVVRWLEMTPAGGWTTIIPAGIEDSAGLCRLLPAATASGQGGSWPILVFVDEVYRTHVVGWPEVAPVGRKKLQNPLLHSVFFFFLFSGDDLLGQFPATEGLYGGDAWLWSVERCLDFTPVVSVWPWTARVCRKKRRKMGLKSAKQQKPEVNCLLRRRRWNWLRRRRGNAPMMVFLPGVAPPDQDTNTPRLRSTGLRRRRLSSLFSSRRPLPLLHVPLFPGMGACIYRRWETWGRG